MPSDGKSAVTLQRRIVLAPRRVAAGVSGPGDGRFRAGILESPTSAIGPEAALPSLIVRDQSPMTQIGLFR